MANSTALFDSDESLADALLNSNEEALNVIYDRYSPILFHALKNVMEDTHLAEEALHLCFISIWQNKHTYNPSNERLFLWLFQMAMNIAVNILEKKSGNKPIQTNSTYVNSYTSTNKDWGNATLIMELLLFGYISEEEAAKKMEITIVELRQMLRKEVKQLRGK
jgi:DNA-directed RNA polymerase specialized sigma24 family protein